jgi:hypothetical protein
LEGRGGLPCLPRPIPQQKGRRAVIDLPAQIDRDTPLRLAEAVKIAFPMGGMTVSGLRREIGRQRLAVEILAGKQFVTLAGIQEMRERCRVKARESDCTSGATARIETATSPTAPHGPSTAPVSPRKSSKKTAINDNEKS